LSKVEIIIKNQRPVKPFKSYLQTKNYRPSTIKSYSDMVKHFKTWTQNENIPLKDIRYADLLAYINVLIEKGDQNKTVNIKLRAITLYYDRLKTSGEIKTNPAETLRMRNITRKLPQNLLNKKTTEKIYKEYPENTIYEKRDKLILSLMTYQALTTADISKLQIRHINLEKAKIYIPQNNRNNSRTLKLKAFQIIPFQNYINEIRPEILKTTNKQNDNLFISTGTSNNMKNTFIAIRRKLQNTNEEFKNFKQIRASVITNLLKHKNIREVQYFAGHRYVSSTERYLINNIEDLKKQVNKYHPLQ